MMEQRPARFLFPVAVLPAPAWWQTLCFQSEYPRGQWTDSPGIASGGSYPWIWTGRPLPVGLFPFTWVQGGTGRRYDSRLASGCNKKPGFSIWKVRILTVNIPNYTENGEITPNLIIDQSTLITAILSLKYHNFPTFLRENLNLHPTSRQESETELTFLQRFSGGVFHNNFYTLIQLKFANVYALLAATARCVRANQTAAENSSRRPDFYEMYSR